MKILDEDDIHYVRNRFKIVISELILRNSIGYINSRENQNEINKIKIK